MTSVHSDCLPSLRAGAAPNATAMEHYHTRDCSENGASPSNEPAVARILCHRIGRSIGREDPSTNLLQKLQLQQGNWCKPQPVRVRAEWTGAAVAGKQKQYSARVQEDHRGRLERRAVRRRI